MNHANSSTERRWRSAPCDEIIWTNWGGEYVAFHRPSGKTHLLNDVSEILLTRILSDARTISEIIDALIDPESGGAGPEYEREILAMLNRFEQLGLVERS